MSALKQPWYISLILKPHQEGVLLEPCIITWENSFIRPTSAARLAVIPASLSSLPSAYLASPSFVRVFKANSLFSLFMDGPSELN